MPPVLEQAGRFRGDLQLVGVGQGPPAVHMFTDFVDERGQVVLLLLIGQTFSFINDKGKLLLGGLLLLWLWNGSDELGFTPGFHDALRWLTGCIKFPVSLWASVGRIKDRVVKKRVTNGLVHKILAAYMKKIGVLAKSHLHESASAFEGSFNPGLCFCKRAWASFLKEHAGRGLNGRDVACFRLRTQGNKGFFRF